MNDLIRIVGLWVLAWFALSLPLGIALGRAMREGRG